MIFRDPELEARFERDGYVVIPLLDRTRAEELRERFQEPVDLGGFAFAASMMSRDVEYRRRASSDIANAIGAGIAAWTNEYRIAFCNYAVKAPATVGGTVVPHRDWTFVDESRYRSMGVWCALCDVGLENGCLHVVPGSQAESVGLRGLYNTVPTPDQVEHLAGRLVAVPMSAGEAMLFDQRIVHMSPPNRSTATRVAACSVLVPEESRLLYVHALPDGDFELFEVDDDFYLEHQIGTRPEHLQPFATVAPV